jgi:phage tail-like protein
MAAVDSSAPSAHEWPLPKFRFEVAWDDVVLNVQEVSGLDMEAQPIEYRHGNSPQFSTLKMPGLKKYSDVTLKKGVFKGDHTFWDWFKQAQSMTSLKKTVTIRLLDETGAPTMVWTLINAWPTKVTGTDLKSQGNEVAVETIVLSHEGLSIANA